MGRERFARSLKAFSIVQGNSFQRQAVYVYGGKGYGKSYILAALACLLVRTGTRVVYIPDCRAWLLNPLSYLRSCHRLRFCKF
jgi:DNA replication protein DnaC